MNQQTSRRQVLLGSTGAGIALLGSAVPVPGQAARRRAAEDTITRSKYGLQADFYIPKANVVTQIPLDVVRFQEGGDASLLADGMVGINTPGLYRICLGLDWKAQAATDIDTRMYGIRRKTASDTGPPSLLDERLASVDVPGSDPPRLGRYEGAWAPPVVPLGGHVYTEVTVGPNNVNSLGDFALASLSTATDDKIGIDAAVALQLQARVIAKNRVRVILSNPSIAGGIAIPPGTLKVLALSATATRGGSEDAWNVLMTPLTRLAAGERIYIAAKNLGVANDYVQASVNSTFLQLERYE
ncbi:MAG: hypothetical protein ACOZJX_17850 [Pseudomonadota bacterium]